jgi:hypothetical protein
MDESFTRDKEMYGQNMDKFERPSEIQRPFYFKKVLIYIKNEYFSYETDKRYFAFIYSKMQIKALRKHIS